MSRDRTDERVMAGPIWFGGEEYDVEARANRYGISISSALVPNEPVSFPQALNLTWDWILESYLLCADPADPPVPYSVERRIS